MTEDVHLCKPCVELKHDYLSFYQEWVDSGEEMVPWVIEKNPSNFPALVDWLMRSENSENLPAGWVPASTYWLVTDSGRVVGVVNIRHALTPHLLNVGGHIGYGIRPSERRKGYATKLLELALAEATQLGISKVLVVCDEGNTGSEKTIRNNGAVQDASYVEESGNVILRFWIER